jgi:hypothetical protein
MSATKMPVKRGSLVARELPRKCDFSDTPLEDAAQGF